MTGCCERVSDGDAAGGGAGTPVFVREIDFSAEPTQNLVNGNNTIAGDTWTGADVGNASLFRTAAGSGLEFQNAAVSTVYTTATRSASRISIPIRSLLPTFEPWWTLYIEWFYSVCTLPTSNNRTLVTFDPNVVPAGSVNRLLGGGRRNTATNQQSYGQVDTTLNGLTTAVDHFSVGMRINARGVVVFSDPAAAYPAQWLSSTASFAAADTGGSVFHPQSLFVLAFVTGSVALGMNVAMERIRFFVL